VEGEDRKSRTEDAEITEVMLFFDGRSRSALDIPQATSIETNILVTLSHHGLTRLSLGKEGLTADESSPGTYTDPHEQLADDGAPVAGQ
jgi:hypothetical protein